MKRRDDWGAAGSRVTVMRRGSPGSCVVRRFLEVSNGRRPSRMPPQVQTKTPQNETKARRRPRKIEEQEVGIIKKRKKTRPDPQAFQDFITKTLKLIMNKQIKDNQLLLPFTPLSLLVNMT